MQESNKIFDLFEKEERYLEEIKKNKPELFVKEEQVASKEILASIGINLPFSNLPLGYIKYHPSDFIVEEIQKNGDIITVDFEKIKKDNQDEESNNFHADLVKISISTLDAIRELTKSLKIKEDQIGTAGIKDADALTSQRISIKDASLKQIMEANPSNIFLKNVESAKGKVQMADLVGNRFTIFIRTAKEINQKAIEEKINKIIKDGAWNFYWLQRFGERIHSHYWGLLLCKGNYEEMVRSYLCDAGPRDLPFFKKTREQARNLFGDWQAIKKLFEPLGYSLRHELIILNHLIKNPNDYIGAVKTMPDQVRLWVYAYSSYLFNQIISHYANSGKKYPQELNLVLSRNRNDREIYKPFLKLDGVPENFEKNLKPFPFIRFLSRQVNTKFTPKIHAIKSLPEGVIISFNLNKGSYATSFLAHFFTLADGLPTPKWVKTKKYDTKKILGTGSTEEAVEKLEKYIIKN